MRTLQMPSLGHIEFDQLCQDIDEFEPLPDPAVETLAADALGPELGDDEHIAPLDERILAGLVTPV